MRYTDGPMTGPKAVIIMVVLFFIIYFAGNTYHVNHKSESKALSPVTKQDINQARAEYTCKGHGGSYDYESKSGNVTCNDGDTFTIETVIKDPNYWVKKDSITISNKQ